jgi:hypothetical protein
MEVREKYSCGISCKEAIWEDRDGIGNWITIVKGN